VSVTLVPFGEEHVEQAARLLAARQRHDRVCVPDLPPRYEDAETASVALRDDLAEPGMAGVAALRAGDLVGFLVGAPVLGDPTRVFAGFMRPRSTEIFYSSHAVDPIAGAGLYRRMYAALAEGWMRDGLTAHYVTIPAHPRIEDEWRDLGFARFIELGVRDTSDAVASPSGAERSIEIRLAEPGDAEAVQTLAAELFRSFADAPIFVPFMPETDAARRKLEADLLADEGCPAWLAFLDGQLAGMQLFVEPTSPEWHLAKQQAPDRSVYLFLACTAPDARSGGIGAALLARGMSWAREAGYERCAVHYLTASRAAPFWRGLGFQPISQWLSRVVDERAIWAHGRD
jgi:GNAT superfamily N-acetyltransferase